MLNSLPSGKEKERIDENIGAGDQKFYKLGGTDSAAGGPVREAGRHEGASLPGKKRGERLKVLMLGWEFPPYFAGGVGVVCHALTKALSRRQHEITYLMPSGPKEVHAENVRLLVADNLVADGRVRVARIDSLLGAYQDSATYRASFERMLRATDGETKSLYGRDLLEEIERFAEKARLIVEEEGIQFDVIHAHDWTTFPAAIALKRATGKPLIVHVHITEFDKTGGEHADPRVYAIEKAGMEAADRVVAVSNLVRNRCVHQYHIAPEKVRVVYNAAELASSPATPEHFEIKARDRVVLFLGRVTLQKGPDYFLAAAKRVIEADPNVKFIMAGTGDMLPRMIERAAELGIGNKVIFPGFVDRESGDRLYRMADVFVMPSVSEPFGIVPLEAMHQGTPVIISRQSGISEVLQHALKVDFWDVDDIAAKILAALSYTALHEELRHQGSVEVRRFDWSVVAERVESLYREVAAW